VSQVRGNENSFEMNAMVIYIQLTLGRQNGNQTKGMNKNINAKAAPNVTGPYLLSFADKPV